MVRTSWITRSPADRWFDWTRSRWSEWAYRTRRIATRSVELSWNWNWNPIFLKWKIWKERATTQSHHRSQWTWIDAQMLRPGGLFSVRQQWLKCVCAYFNLYLSYLTSSSSHLNPNYFSNPKRILIQDFIHYFFTCKNVCVCAFLKQLLFVYKM